MREGNIAFLNTKAPKLNSLYSNNLLREPFMGAPKPCSSAQGPCISFLPGSGTSLGAPIRASSCFGAASAESAVQRPQGALHGQHYLCRCKSVHASIQP